MMLAMKLIQREQEAERDEVQFERDLFIGNPDFYQEYIKNKQDDIKSGNEGITWIAPENAEEARQLMDVFADIDQQLNKNEQAVDEQFVKQLGIMNLLDGINVDEIGGDE
jgi:hypothetical protein